MNIQLNLENTYTKPEGALTVEQYVNFVMNMACASYKNQYNKGSIEEGLQAACDAYNASLE